jgi:hypothetical protein
VRHGCVIDLRPPGRHHRPTRRDSMLMEGLKILDIIKALFGFKDALAQAKA